MKVNEMTVEVIAKLTVEKETAETCLKMVELYCNQTRSHVIGTRGFEGSVQFHFEDIESIGSLKNEHGTSPQEGNE